LEGDGGAEMDDSGGAVAVRSATNSETTKITIKPRGDRSWWDPFVIVPKMTETARTTLSKI
jgi:hypothetical protein